MSGFKELKFNNKKEALTKRDKIEKDYGYASSLFVARVNKHEQYIILEPDYVDISKDIKKLEEEI